MLETIIDRSCNKTNVYPLISRLETRRKLEILNFGVHPNGDDEFELVRFFN